MPAWSNEVDPWAYAHAGVDHFYNFEYPEAIADFKKAIESDPDNLLFRNYLANTYLFTELSRLGKLEGNLYDASNSFLKEKSEKEPDAKTIGLFREQVKLVRARAEARLEKNPRDVEALYALGATYGMEGNYLFTIEKKYFDALKAGGKANELHEKVLKIDPNYHDAKLIPGVYEYVVGSIPRSVKWLAFLFGYRGSKERGVQLLQETMVKGKLAATDAAFLLAVVYNREKQFEYSRRLLTRMSDFFPRNPLIRLEIGRTYTREGLPDKTIEHYVAVAKDVDAGKYAPDKVPRERLWYQIGTLYQQRGKHPEALDAYARVTDRHEGDGLMKAYSGLRRGEIFLAQNRMDRARAEYERVAAMPYDEPRKEAQARLRSMDGKPAQ
ncbi:MAG: tetratricopeptide repeat protein [Candidatus Acidiferrales bacterium]